MTRSWWLHGLRIDGCDVSIRAVGRICKVVLLGLAGLAAMPLGGCGRAPSLDPGPFAAAPIVATSGTGVAPAGGRGADTPAARAGNGRIPPVAPVAGPVLATPGAPRAAPDVYAGLAPWVAFVETPLATGTGVRIDGARLVTNAHVVWPFDRARVVFADGREIPSAAVTGLDLMADLAVLDLQADRGALGVAAAPPVADGGRLAVGSDVYFVGYPAEVEAFPQPAMTRGILSRSRVWEALGMRFLQTDADLAGGQSGGALAAADGSVIGISSMIFGDDAFGLAMAMPDVLARVERLAAGVDVDGLAPRVVPLSGGSPTRSATLDHPWAEAVYAVNAAFGASVAVDARPREAGADVHVDVISPYGDVVPEDPEDADGATGPDDGAADLPAMGGTAAAGEGSGDHREPGGAHRSFTVDADGPFFVAVTADPGGAVDVSASVPLAAVVDPDDGTPLVAAPGLRAPGEGRDAGADDPPADGRTLAASMDYPGDVDAFTLALRAGQTAVVTVETLNFVPDIVVDHPTRPGLAPPLLDTRVDSPLGLAARAAFVAAESTTYLIVVRDLDGVGTGGYFIRVGTE